MKRVLLLLLAVSACASDPAPIDYGGGATRTSRADVGERHRAPEREPAPEPPREARQHPGAAPNWAEGEGTPLSAYALRPEEAQPFDPAHLPRTHRVGPNESLFDIATLYQIPLRALIDQNRLEPPYALAPGRVIDLPPPRLHRVARGESFEDVARRYNVDRRSLALLNRMSAPYEVRVGDQVVLPAMARARVEPSPVVESATEAPAPPSGPARFGWPVRGEILARYGEQSDGRRLDGVEIAAREGESVTAAADGDVVYAGSDLPAYGALVLIRHADNYVTAYGYGRRALVREGQRVRAGEAVAEAGPRERVLFQVRQGAQAVDPAPLLGN